MACAYLIVCDSRTCSGRDNIETGMRPYLLQVPVEEFKENLTAICESLNAMLPAASIIMATPPPINNQVWPASTNKKGYGGGRSLER